MSIYRPKSREIRAFCWTGGIDQREDPEWFVPYIAQGVAYFDKGQMIIRTGYAFLCAHPGDYVSQDHRGKLRVYPPHDFLELYDHVGPEPCGEEEQPCIDSR